MSQYSAKTSAQKIFLSPRLYGYLFVFLCLLHFFSQRPLWLDENFVLKNMKELNYSQIFGPLNYSQGFPRVYLAIIKFFGQHFDYHVLVLRIFSLLAMLAAYGVWARIFRVAFGQTREWILALSSFACSYAMSGLNKKNWLINDI